MHIKARVCGNNGTDLYCVSLENYVGNTILADALVWYSDVSSLVGDGNRKSNVI